MKLSWDAAPCDSVQERWPLRSAEKTESWLLSAFTDGLRKTLRRWKRGRIFNYSTSQHSQTTECYAKPPGLINVLAASENATYTDARIGHLQIWKHMKIEKRFTESSRKQKRRSKSKRRRFMDIYCRIPGDPLQQIARMGQKTTLVSQGDCPYEP